MDARILTRRREGKSGRERERESERASERAREGDDQKEKKEAGMQDK